MEPKKQIKNIDPSFLPSTGDDHLEYFKKAYGFTTTYYKSEYETISSVSFKDLTPQKFFSEYVWVVHATGFSAKAVGGFIPKLMLAYGTHESLSQESFNVVMERVKLVCNNPQKAKAVFDTASLLSKVPWADFKRDYLSSKEKIQTLPYIGKVTCYHLGRNIGHIDMVKPDLHLVRLADRFGFSSSEDMIKSMSPDDSIPLGLRDLCVWYYASTFGTIEYKKEGQR